MHCSVQSPACLSSPHLDAPPPSTPPMTACVCASGPQLWASGCPASYMPYPLPSFDRLLPGAQPYRHVVCGRSGDTQQEGSDNLGQDRHRLRQHLATQDSKTDQGVDARPSFAESTSDTVIREASPNSCNSDRVTSAALREDIPSRRFEHIQYCWETPMHSDSDSDYL